MGSHTIFPRYGNRWRPWNGNQLTLQARLVIQALVATSLPSHPSKLQASTSPWSTTVARYDAPSAKDRSLRRQAETFRLVLQHLETFSKQHWIHLDAPRHEAKIARWTCHAKPGYPAGRYCQMHWKQSKPLINFKPGKPMIFPFWRTIPYQR